MNHSETDHARSSRTLRLVCWAAIVGAACFSFTTATAQTLEDWEAALSAAKSDKGIESIPYPDLREEAKEEGKLVDQLCKTDTWTCDGLETRALREEIRGRSENIEKLKGEQDQLEDQLSDAETDDAKREIEGRIEEITEEIEQKEDELEFKKKSLETDLSDIDIRIERGNDCLEARTSVYLAFDEAIDRAEDESDPAIKPIASELIAYWEKGNEKHIDAIEGVEAGLEKCEKCKSGDL